VCMSCFCAYGCPLCGVLTCSVSGSGCMAGSCAKTFPTSPESTRQHNGSITENHRDLSQIPASDSQLDETYNTRKSLKPHKINLPLLHKAVKTSLGVPDHLRAGQTLGGASSAATPPLGVRAWPKPTKPLRTKPLSLWHRPPTEIPTPT